MPVCGRCGVLLIDKTGKTIFTCEFSTEKYGSFVGKYVDIVKSRFRNSLLIIAAKAWDE